MTESARLDNSYENNVDKRKICVHYNLLIHFCQKLSQMNYAKINSELALNIYNFYCMGVLVQHLSELPHFPIEYLHRVALLLLLFYYYYY